THQLGKNTSEMRSLTLGLHQRVPGLFTTDYMTYFALGELDTPGGRRQVGAIVYSHVPGTHLGRASLTVDIPAIEPGIDPDRLAMARGPLVATRVGLIVTGDRAFRLASPRAAFDNYLDLQRDINAERYSWGLYRAATLLPLLGTADQLAEMLERSAK